MKQYDILAEEKRLSRLSPMGDPLEKIAAIIDWEIFRAVLDEAFKREAKGPGGRPPIDRVMMFKIVMLQQWYHIADDATEYVINDRLSFQRFLGLGLTDRVPDAKTIWLFKETLKETHKDTELFALFNRELEEKGVITHTGSIVDASFVDVPRQRNSKKENETIKNGEIPEDWKRPENSSKFSQKDTDARWAKKGEEVHFGYKDHVKIDKDSKIITDFDVTPAEVHDSQCFRELIDEQDKEVWADSGYVGKELQAEILIDHQEVILHINEKGSRNNPVTGEHKENNRKKSKVRARVEHIFGYMTNSMGGMYIRCIGYSRAIRDITMKNLAYNIRRFVYLAGAGKVLA